MASHDSHACPCDPTFPYGSKRWRQDCVVRDVVSSIPKNGMFQLNGNKKYSVKQRQDTAYNRYMSEIMLQYEIIEAASNKDSSSKDEITAPMWSTVFLDSALRAKHHQVLQQCRWPSKCDQESPVGAGVSNAGICWSLYDVSLMIINVFYQNQILANSFPEQASSRLCAACLSISDNANAIRDCSRKITAHNFIKEAESISKWSVQECLRLSKTSRILTGCIWILPSDIRDVPVPFSPRLRSPDECPLAPLRSALNVDHVDHWRYWSHDYP